MGRIYQRVCDLQTFKNKKKTEMKLLINLSLIALIFASQTEGRTLNKRSFTQSFQGAVLNRENIKHVKVVEHKDNRYVSVSKPVSLPSVNTRQNTHVTQNLKTKEEKRFVRCMRQKASPTSGQSFDKKFERFDYEFRAANRSGRFVYTGRYYYKESTDEYCFIYKYSL